MIRYQVSLTLSTCTFPFPNEQFEWFFSVDAIIRGVMGGNTCIKHRRQLRVSFPFCNPQMKTFSKNYMTSYMYSRLL